MIGQTISHYKILEKLGEGGMGVVYKAEDTRLDRFVAIKILPSHLSASTDSNARFLQEAKATAALSHPNILSVFDVGESNGSMFIVLELVEGRTLDSYISNLKTGSGIPVKQALDWVLQITRGLKAAHDKNIIHRDIKPHNLMLTNNDQIKIMDFGLAKLTTAASITKSGT
jgi:serine/threonine protein kinase